MTLIALLLPGNYSTLLQYLEKYNDSVDVQLWKRLADPVLVHDAFSSFTWLLFCLPLPFPANGAPFTALVHLFYLVSIVQVLSLMTIYAYLLYNTDRAHTHARTVPLLELLLPDSGTGQPIV